MVHLNSQKDVLPLNVIPEVQHVNSLQYGKSLILYWMTLVLCCLAHKEGYRKQQHQSRTNTTPIQWLGRRYTSSIVRFFKEISHRNFLLLLGNLSLYTLHFCRSLNNVEGNQIFCF